jgi:hypothetical protein
MLNISSFYVIKGFYIQGNGVIFFTPSLRFVRYLIHTYTVVGYLVNNTNTYIAPYHVEFLRCSYERDGVTEYLPYSFVNIRFRNSIQTLTRLKSDYASRFQEFHPGLCLLFDLPDRKRDAQQFADDWPCVWHHNPPTPPFIPTAGSVQLYLIISDWQRRSYDHI